jgi:prepilin-type N-terminal cleavage/methylation domain-containing protein
MSTRLPSFRANSSEIAHRGFSLVEIAIVMVIIAILITAVGIPLATQIDQQRNVETQKQLEQIKEAIYGYAMANGRLPCPATVAGFYGVANSNGVQSPNVNGTCTVKVGYVPAVTLGLLPVDADKVMVDAWGLTQNRVLYAVADRDIPSSPSCAIPQTAPLTTIDGARNATIACINSVTFISVCAATPTGGSPGAATACPAAQLLTDKAPFVLISRGKNATTLGGIDEQHNIDMPATPPALRANQDTFFVSRLPSPASASNGEFDDIVTWGNLNTLILKMTDAGKLP